LDQPASGDTGGLFFPKAIQHTIIGLYLQQIVLAALMFLAKAIAQGAVVVILIIVTAFCHLVINNSFHPLIHSLPLTYARRGYASHADEASGKVESDLAQNDFEKDRKISMTSETREPVVEEEAGPSVAVEGKRNEGPTDFTHPAAVEPQRTIWMPQDELGLALSEVADLRERGIGGSTENALLDAKGHTEITGHPPGMILE
jgi:calcium permeable stress-gated cation channel